MSKSSGESEKTTATQTDPWAPAVPDLQSLLQKLGAGINGTDVTPAQSDAFARLKTAAANGNPWAGQIGSVATDQLGFGSNSGAINDAVAGYTKSVQPVADGTMLDFANNPHLQAMLAKAGADARNAVASQFAGAGMTGSSIEQGAIGSGIVQAELPLLLQQYNAERGNQTAAQGNILNAQTSGASAAQGLDTSALSARAAGAGTAGNAMAAQNWGDTQILNLENQQQMLPYQNLSTIAAMLLPMAGLGGTQNGTSTTSTDSSSMSIEGIGKAISGLSSILAFSDERVKEDIEHIGELEDGSKIYRFRYKGDPKVHIGLIAQEVEKRQPSAVVEIGGIKAVNIKKATNKAARMVQDNDRDGE